MNPELSIAALMPQLAAFIWPLSRVAGIFMIAPVLGSQLAPMRIRAAAAVAISLALLPNLPPLPQVDPFSAEGLLILANQILIGLLMGFVLQMVFAALMVAAEQVSMAMGLGMAQMTDPQNGTSVPVIGQIQLVVATLLFLSLNGHHALIYLVSESFHSLPIGPRGLSPEGLWSIIGFSSQVFSDALRLALPAVTALLATNMAMGVITRSAPQMNLFSIGLPVTTMLGLGVLWVQVDGSVDLFGRLIEKALDALALGLSF
ncbi:MAG: flagellar biosynthetic protein FliR [Gammaproteobacteria bacterium]|nr:flagellar biosynthetic protein FliR [Gammaproteobacteria bacterium]